MSGILLVELPGFRSILHNCNLHSIHKVGYLRARRGPESSPSSLSRITKRHAFSNATPFPTITTSHDGQNVVELPVAQEFLEIPELTSVSKRSRFFLDRKPLLLDDYASGDPDVRFFFKALREGDTFKLYLRLLRLVSSTAGLKPAFQTAMLQVPPATYSEILRCLDPFVVCKQVDSAPEIVISERMAQNTFLGQLINKWGVKIIYVQILNRLRQIHQLRRERGLQLLPNDYIVLIRCAGAASDISVAKSIWSDMQTDHYHVWRQSEMFSEFVKVRYLTEQLYSNNDLARFRIGPLDLHRSKMMLPWRTVIKLKALRSYRLRMSNFRFGQNMRSPSFAEVLTRILRRTRPIQRMTTWAVIRRWVPGSEKMTCSLMKAHARTGGLHFLDRILRYRWGISLHWESGLLEVSGGTDFPTDSPAAPTVHLLDTIVHCYGSNAEIQMASSLLNYISTRYNIPIPDKIWSNLLEYTYIAGSKPASTEWRYAGVSWRSKVPRAEAVSLIWDAATAEPYNFRPGIRDYHNLVRSLVAQKRVVEAIQAMRQLKPLYDSVLQESEEAWFELVETTQQGVDNHACYRRFKLLQAKKVHIGYSFEYQSLLILKSVRISAIVEQDKLVTLIPDFVREFAIFMPPHIRYRTSTGYVSIRSDRNTSWADFGYRLVDIPAHGPRYRHSRSPRSDPNEPTMQDLKRQGLEFTGFHNIPKLAKYAARREWRMFRRPASAAWDFQSLENSKLESSFLRTST